MRARLDVGGLTFAPMGTRGTRSADPYTVSQGGAVLVGRPDPANVPASGPQELQAGSEAVEAAQGQRNPPKAATGRWLPLMEAANRMGASQAAIRRRIDAGELRSRGSKKRPEVFVPGAR